IIGITLFVIQIANAAAQVYLSEGFENGTKPAGWTEEYVSGTEPWRYRNGGHSPNDNNWTIPPYEEDITRNPPSAHSGTYNAIFFKQSTNQERTKLITKPINLEGAIEPELSFWLCQVPWTFSGNTNWDYLRVYYKNDIGNDWTLLQEFLDPISEWTEFKINLPNPSSTYYIAFEGQTNWGFGTGIDDVVVEETGFQERYVSELTVTHPDFTFIPSENKNEPILRLGFKVFGNTGNATLKTLAVKSKNSNDSDIETNGVKLYFTTTTLFDTLTPLSTPQSFVNGLATFNNINFNLPNGQSYVWVTYDVKQSATHGNIADAMINALSIQVSDSLYPKQNEDPTGNRLIYETIYRENFEGAHNWTLSGEFEVDQPQGLGGSPGYPDPTSAFSGTKVLGTDLTGLGEFLGNYENNVSEADAYKAISPAIDALFYKDLRISYRRYLNIEVWDRATVDVSKDNGGSWSNIWFNNNYFTDNLWQKTSHTVPSDISRSNRLKFMFKLGPTDNYITYSGWNVDDFVVTGDYITKDVGVVEWVYPLSGCGHSATDSVVVKVANLGAEPTPASIPVQYSFDNGATWVTNYLNQVIAPADTVEFTFSTKVNLSTPGIKQVRARTRLTGDEDPSNDGISAQIYIVPTYTLPYTETFENNDGYWRKFGNPIWEWGILTKPSMSGGTKVWATGLSQNYGSLLVGTTDTIFYDDFETEKGWTFTGEFERNYIIMQWDTIPTYTYSGQYCIGTDLSRQGANKGMYEPNVTWYAKSPAIDVSNYNNLTLNFYYWHRVAEGDTAMVQASSNGTTWKTIYTSNGSAINNENWEMASISIPDSLANSGTLYIQFVLKSNDDANVAEGINFDDVWITGSQFNSETAWLQSPCFDFSGVTNPIIDLNIFNHTEPEVDGATLYYSTDNGQTWQHVGNSASHDEYFNWYTDSLVSALGVDGWNGLGTGWERSRHELPTALAGESNVIFRIAFKVDKAYNDYGGTAIDNIKLYEAPFDVGVESILSPSTACDLSANQNIEIRIRNYGIRDMQIGDTIIVNLNIEHDLVPDSETDTIVLTSALNAGDYLDYTFICGFNMNISGDYYLTAFTSIEPDPLFYASPSNDAATKLVTVQKPYVELGPDIWTLQPDTVVLDATNTDHLVTYKWYKAPDMTTVISTAPTYSVTDTDGGKYYVQLENSIPCQAWDSVTVHRLIRDVGIPAFDSPVSSCELSDKTPIKVYVKNYGTDTLTIGDTIRISYKFNSNPIVDSVWVSDRIIIPGDSTIFTFSDSLDMQAIGTYTIKAWANVWLDEDADNDTINSTVDVWGYPTFSFAIDTIPYAGVSYTVDAGEGWDAYYWHNDGSTNQTFEQTQTGWAKVTVYDTNNCPATDSVFIDFTFSDITIDTLLVPQTACEISGLVYPKIIIRNAGTVTIASGTDIDLSYKLNEILQESPTLTLNSEFYPNETKEIIFGNGIDMSVPGTYNFEFVAKTASDNKPENDTLKQTVYIYGYPTLELGDSVFTRNSSYLLDAGAGRDSYLWNTNETSQTITVNQTGWYKVTVTENGICSSKDSVYVTFLKHDYALTEITNPTTSCSVQKPQSVSIKYTNVSNDTLKAGEQVRFGYQINEIYFAEEIYTLSANLTPGQFIQFTFSEPIDLSSPDTYDMVAYGIYVNDTITNNDTLTITFTIMESPVVDLGEDRIDRTGSVTLDGGEGTDYTYLWSDNSTERFLIVENSGTYHVETTAPNGCFDRDTVTLIILKPDYRVSDIIAPNTSCTLSTTEQVQVEVENVGTDTLQIGQSIFVSYEVNNTLQQTEAIIMTSMFKPGDKLTHTFTKTFNFSTPSSYTIKAYTTSNDDINPLNDSSSKTIDVWGLPNINLGVDTAICQGTTHTLNAGTGFSSYLWNTGATSQTINVSTAGLYWVEVTDSHGCINRDTINVETNLLPTVTHDPLDAVCLDDPEFILSGGNPSGGIYSGPGTHITTFTAADAGAGTHTLTYTYTDANGCSNSTNVDITVHPLPVVDLGENRSTTEPLILDAGSGFVSYLWQDNSTNQTFTVNESGLYSVTVTDNNGCQGYDEVYITYLETLDIIVSNLLSPADKCFDNKTDSVKVELLNRGTKTFTTGETIDVNYFIGTSTPVKEQYTFTTNLPQNGTVQFKFSTPIALSTGQFNFTCFTTIAGDNGDSTEFTVNVWELPNLDFGSDTIRHSLPYELTSGIEGVTYLWSTGATSPSITISNGQWGKYWLTVTDSHGCVAYDTVVIWWPVSAETIANIPYRVSIYPNPANHELYVQVDGDRINNYKIEFIAPSGLMVEQAEIIHSNSFTQKFNVNRLQPGMYFIRIANSQGYTSIKKVIIGSR
ncbi:MAG TPA: T9SS type A sorting domain-containing protein, partial [Bacteroidales bacterium]|nr:T9SS type A sorting domain-containing protein [Bacteroidales bacterium]